MNQLAVIVVDNSLWEIPLKIFYVVGVFAIIYLFFIDITLRMAKKRNRDPLGWILLSFFITPLFVWIILIIAGKRKS